jgi:hypothetical protein
MCVYCTAFELLIPWSQRSLMELAAMNIEIVHHQMDRLRCRVLQRLLVHHSRKPESRTIRRRKGKMATGLGLQCAKNIGRATPLVRYPVLPSALAGPETQGGHLRAE